LVHGFLYELREAGTMSCESDRLQLSADSFLQKTLSTLSTTVDEYASEQSKFQYQQRLIARTKRAADEAAGDDGPIAKTATQPSRLESMLLANQLSNYCDQIQTATKMSFNKLYVAEALSKTAAVGDGDKFVTEEQWNSSIQGM
jgi:translation initiation factor 3 subunit H